MQSFSVFLAGAILFFLLGFLEGADQPPNQLQPPMQPVTLPRSVMWQQSGCMCASEMLHAGTLNPRALSQLNT